MHPSDLSLLQLSLIAGLATFSAIAGGVAGYGTGALMPLVLVPILGAAPVVPIIAISAVFTNSARMVAFRPFLEWRRALIALVHNAFFNGTFSYLYDANISQGESHDSECSRA